MKNIFLTALIFLCMGNVFSQNPDPKLNDFEAFTYKKTQNRDLNIYIKYPDSYEGKKLPCVVFFFGGGWNGGKPSQFKDHANFIASKGAIGIVADYRVKKFDGTTPFVSVSDAKSVMRFVRKNAEKLGIDTSMIVAGGGSAGGHLAAATALIEKYSDDTDDLSISPKPKALILFNPVLDNGPGGYGYERIGDEYKDFSPLHNITKGAPPTLIMVGTKDKYVFVDMLNYYKLVMEKVGSRCDVHFYPGEEHGFFNKYKSEKNYNSTINQMDTFLKSLNFYPSN